MKALIFLLLFVPAAAMAQVEASPDNQIAQMKKLDFMVGDWEGEGWIAFGPGPRSTFKSTERIRMKLGGVALLVEGHHTSTMEAEKGRVVHDALAMLTYNEATDEYDFRTQLASGRGGNYIGKIMDDGTFVWGIDAPNGYKIRYTITIDDKGRWVEVGESSPDGESWQQFFEMKLTKVSK